MSTGIRSVSLGLLTSLAVLAPAGGAVAKQLMPGREATRAYSLHATRLRADGVASSTRQEPSFLPFSGQGDVGSALVGAAPVGNGPSTVAIDAATHTIYAANGFNLNGPFIAGDTVSVIDGRRCNAQDVSRCKGPWPTVTVGNGPSTIAIDRATDTVYVTNNSDNTVSVFNGAICNAQATSGCGQTPATVPVGSGPIGIFADHANHTVYVGNFNDGSVSMIDSATCNATNLASCPTNAPPAVTVAGGPAT